MPDKHDHPEREIPHGNSWNRIIKDMPLAAYCAWRAAKRPGFESGSALEIESWLKTWKLKARRFPQGAKNV